MGQRAQLVLAVTSALTVVSVLALVRYDRARPRRARSLQAPDVGRGAPGRAAPQAVPGADARAPASSRTRCLIEQIIGCRGPRAPLPASLSRYREALGDPEQFPRYGSFSPGERREGPLPLRAELEGVEATLTSAGARGGPRRSYHLELRAGVEPALERLASFDFRVEDHETLYAPRRVGDELRILAITCHSRE